MSTSALLRGLIISSLDNQLPCDDMSGLTGVHPAAIGFRLTIAREIRFNNFRAYGLPQSALYSVGADRPYARKTLFNNFRHAGLD